MCQAILVGLVICAAPRDDASRPISKTRPAALIAPFDSEKAMAAQEAWASHLGKSSPTERNSIGMELSLIPPGRFTMGSSATEEGRNDNEIKVNVTLTRPFYLSKTEVTQAQWQAVMGTSPWKGKEYVREGDAYPAVHIMWDDAKAFCKELGKKEKASYRLPTEAEWEYGCRAGTTTRFSFGDDDARMTEFEWYYGNAAGLQETYPHQVGKKSANPFGLHDMHGNVGEWCQDAYADRLAGGVDPLTTRGNLGGVLRGGVYFATSGSCRSGFRWLRSPVAPVDFCLGFRVAREVAQ